MSVDDTDVNPMLGLGYPKSATEAASKGFVSVLGDMVAAGHDVQAGDPRNRHCTPLHAAAAHGHMACLRWLVEHAGANLEVTQADGATPLLLACSSGHEEAAAFLVQRGAAVNATARGGWAPLHHAAHAGHVDLVRALLRAGARVMQANDKGATPLHSACIGGHVAVLRMLLCAVLQQVQEQEGVPATSGERCATEGGEHVDDGAGSMHERVEEAHDGAMAALCGLVKVQRLVLQLVNTPSTPGNRTPLREACERGHAACVKALLATGLYGHGEHLDDAAWLSLQAAVVGNHVDVVQHVLRHRRDMAFGACSSWTVLHWAADAGGEAMVRLVVSLIPARDRRRAVNAATDTGITPLHGACHAGSLSLIAFLLEQGADAQAVSLQGATPLHYAAECQTDDVVAHLLEHGADPCAADHRGWTPLGISCAAGTAPVARVLLDVGRVPLNAAGAPDGASPLRIALRHRHPACAAVLVKRGAPVARADVVSAASTRVVLALMLSPHALAAVAPCDTACAHVLRSASAVSPLAVAHLMARGVHTATIGVKLCAAVAAQENYAVGSLAAQRFLHLRTDRGWRPNDAQWWCALPPCVRRCAVGWALACRRLGWHGMLWRTTGLRLVLDHVVRDTRWLLPAIVLQAIEELTADGTVSNAVTVRGIGETAANQHDALLFVQASV